MRKAISAFLAFVYIFTTLGFFTLGASAEGERTVYATTSTSIQQGNYGYLYVYLDDLTDLSALNISVYYDTEKITVKSATNNVSATVYDINTSGGCVNASYIFDGKGEAKKTQLFYIYYQVNSTAEIGDAYFDITVGDAYDSSLNEMSFRGSRCSFKVSEKLVTKSCSVSSTSSLSTSVGEEFSLSYRLNTYQLASGTMEIRYDPELFEVASVTAGGFLSGKISDINTSLRGSVYISFVSTAYQYQYDLVTVKFKTIKNVSETSEIKLTASELYDLNLTNVTCSGYTTKVNVNFDDTYTEDSPSVSVSAEYSADTEKLTAYIRLAKDSLLGAGDFVLNFDNNVLTYESAKKGFSPTFFNVNAKKVSDGILKFSVISLEDITDEQMMLAVTFDITSSCSERACEFDISGSGLTDSLTNKILLNFVGTSTIVPARHSAVVDEAVPPTSAAPGLTEGSHCSECGAVIVPQEEIPPITPSPDFKIRGASLSLSNDINIVYKALVPSYYTNAYMVFTFAGVDYTVYGTKNSDGSYSYMFTEVLPQMIGENIKATLYATNEYGEQVSVCVKEYSVLTYCTNKLKSSTDAKFKTMLSDLLVYGAAAQKYSGYKTDALVTAGLESIMTPTEFSSVDASANKQQLTGTADASAKWRSAGLLYENAMAMYIKFAATDISNLEVHITINGETEIYTKNDFILDSDGYYKIYYRGIYFTEFDDAVVATFHRNGAQIGQTLNYSINTYVYKNQNHQDQATRELMRATYNYGASAYTYSKR